MLSFLFTLFLFWIILKGTFGLIGFFGRLAGGIIGFLFYITVGSILLVFGIGFVFLPILLIIAGLISIIGMIIKAA